MRTPTITYYLCWVDDISSFVGSFASIIELLETQFEVKLSIDEHNSTNDFETIARALTDDGHLIYLVDYNLKGHDGNGINGDAIIKMIRQYNKNCPIVFYSSQATQQDLRLLVKDISGVVCVPREELPNVLNRIASGELFARFR